MRKRAGIGLRGFAVAVILSFGVFFAIVMTVASWPKYETNDPLASVLKVVLGGGHGSGVMIARGMFVTAAHVAGDNETVKLIDSTGHEAEGTILWTSKRYDIAVGSIGSGIERHPAALSCQSTTPGESITAIGNPLTADFIRSRGIVSGKEFTDDDHERAVMVDLTVLPGMSGGPVFNEHGAVVGIVVSLLTLGPMPIGITHFGRMVPSTQVCKMLGKI